MLKSGEKMNLNQETRNNISKNIEKTLGISLEIFEQLDFDEQQKLIAIHKEKIKREKHDEVIAMIGSGGNATFTKAKVGKRIMIGSGEDSTFLRAGISSEEVTEELNNKIVAILDNEPVPFVKKLQRRISNK